MGQRMTSVSPGPCDPSPSPCTMAADPEDHGENDHEREPETREILREVFYAAGLPAEIEVYGGAREWRPGQESNL